MTITDSQTQGTPTIDLDAALELVRARADASERAGRVDADVLQALRDAGINRLLLPTAFGGHESSPRTCVEVIEQIAEADGSIGWAAAIGLGSNLFAGYVPASGAAEIFADPDATNAGMFAPLGQVSADLDGTLRLTGSWPFTSNCLHASWIGVGAFFPTPDGSEPEPIPRLVFLPATSVTIEQTWDVNGMRATGSHHVVVDAQVVERTHSCIFGEPAWADGPLWRLPLFTALAPCLAAVFLGIARGALDELAHQTRERKGRMRPALVDEPLDVADLARADIELRAARAGLLDLLDHTWSLAVAGDPVDRILQARTLLAVHHVVEVSVEVTSTVHRLGGGHAAYNDSPLLRALRDVHTARQHMLFARGMVARLGPSAAGIDTFIPPFVV
jgi:indole-3-acetate monooxygenase